MIVYRNHCFGVQHKIKFHLQKNSARNAIAKEAYSVQFLSVPNGLCDETAYKQPKCTGWDKHIIKAYKFKVYKPPAFGLLVCLFHFHNMSYIYDSKML